MHETIDLLARQDGLASLTQLADLGVGRGAVRGRLARGEWERWGPAVVGVAGVADSWRRRVRAALLTSGPDAVVSHATAARMHGLDGFEHDESLHVSVCGGGHRRGFAATTVHRSKLLTRKDCVVIDGMPVVSRPLALVQIADTSSRDTVQRALDGLLRSGGHPRWIEQVAMRWCRPGVGGASLVLDVLRECTATRLPRSWFQRLAKRVLAEQGVVMVDEHPVHGPDGRLLAELDLAIPELMIGLECQSWEFHGSPAARAADARRRRTLRLIGWELVELWWSDLDRIDDVVAEVGFLIDAQRGKLPGSGSPEPRAGNLGGRDRAREVSRRGGTRRVPSR